MDLTSAHSHVLFLLYIFSWCSLYSPCWFQCYCPEGVIGPFLSHSSPSLQRSSSQLQQNAGFWWLSAREISLIRQEIWMNWHAHHSAQVYSAALKSMGCSSSLSGPAEGKAGHNIGDHGNFSCATLTSHSWYDATNWHCYVTQCSLFKIFYLQHFHIV